MKGGGDLHPAGPDWWSPTKRPRATPGGLIAASVTYLSRLGVCAPVLAHVPPFGRNPRGSPDFLAYPVPKACMHVPGTGVPRCLGVARSALSPKAAQALGCSLTPGLRISFRRLALVLESGFCGNPANRGWGLGCVCLGKAFGFVPPFLAGVCGVCGWAWGLACPPTFLAGVLGRVWLRARSAWTPPLLARVCGVGVCAWAPVLAAPGHSWLGRWGVCIFVRALRLYPATPGWAVRCGCVCLGSGFGCARPLMTGVLRCVCVFVRALCVPRDSWLVCAVWVCLLGLGSRPHHATPGWNVGVCVCLCTRFACTPPLLAGVCGVCVCVRGLGFRLRPTTPSWGVVVCVCSCARSTCTLPLLAGVCGVGVSAWARVSAAPRHSWLGCWGVCVFVCVLRVYPSTPGGGVRCGCVCLDSGFGCAPPLLAGVLGCVCVFVRAPYVPRHSWRGCAVWVCLLGLGSRLRPVTPGWGVGVCVCLCARSAFTLRLLAGQRTHGSKPPQRDTPSSSSSSGSPLSSRRTSGGTTRCNGRQTQPKQRNRARPRGLGLSFRQFIAPRRIGKPPSPWR